MLLCLFGGFLMGCCVVMRWCGSDVLVPWWWPGGGVIVLVAVGCFKEEGEREKEEERQREIKKK